MLLRVILIFIVCFVAYPSLASDLQATRITGIYSSLSYNEESGDLSGMELLIFPTRQVPDLEYSAFVQVSEGGAPDTSIIPLHVKGNKFEFTFPSGGAYSGRHIFGTFHGSNLEIKWDSGSVDHLKRGKSYWE